jgi:tryptophan-rich sensory protein
MAELEIVVLLVAIALTVVAFWRVRPLAGALLLPYLAWVTFATALTFALVRRNPTMF